MCHVFSLTFLLSVSLLAATCFAAQPQARFDDIDPSCTSCECRCNLICSSTSLYRKQPSGSNTLTPTPTPTQTPTSIPAIYSKPSDGDTARAQACVACGRENLDILNKYRMNNGLQALKWDDELARKAEAHSKEMYGHLSLYHSKYGGWENVAFSYALTNWSGVADSMFEQWRKSAGHNRNMLTPNIACAGIAMYGDGKRFYGTQIFMTSC